MDASMGMTTVSSLQISSVAKNLSKSPTSQLPNSNLNSMSQEHHQGIFGFSDGFDRSTTNQEHHNHIAQQNRRSKLRVQGFDASGNPTLVPISDNEDQEAGIYGSANVNTNNMLSDMFGFAAGSSGPELLASQIAVGGYRVEPRQALMSGFATDWYANRPEILLSNSSALSTINQSAIKVENINPDQASAMQLFLMNPTSAAAQPPPPPRSPSPSAAPQLGHFHSFAETSFGGGGGGVEGQALSLTLSSSLQQYGTAKAEDVGVREGLLYFNNHNQQHSEQQNNLAHLQGQEVIQGRQFIGSGNCGSIGMVNMLRNSKYTRPAQELLEEFCNVGRGKIKGSRIGKSSNHNPTSAGASTSVPAATSSSSKEPPPLNSAERFEHQRKKTKLISMLDEVDRRYNHYCDQIQMVVNSFDSVMGSGAATRYTALTKRAMSRHFRCLKDAIAAQLKQTCELLGEKEGTSNSGITKGDTPRLRALDQSLRQQRAFHQMGMMDQEAWRPQRGLPEHSVSLLRAWLFEHFLHPYPSDADKHLLARQSGLSRNQVSNWFINARVRLWKPMIEEMYQQEFKDDSDEPSEGDNQRPPESPNQQQQHQQEVQRHKSYAPPAETNPSTSSSSQHNHHPPSGMVMARGGVGAGEDNVLIGLDALADSQAGDMYRYGTASAMRFGATTGDISLTLGLRHAGGNAQTEKNRFSVRDFEFDSKDYC